MTVKTHWYPARFFRTHAIPLSLRAWLLDENSLTRRLQQHCDGRFSVRVLQQCWQHPRLDESRILNMRQGEVALVRQVQLLCDGMPMVFARTVIPVRSLSGSERRLAHLGNRPLGEFLFSNPSLQRGEMELARIDSGSVMGRVAVQGLKNKPATIWGRRSVFSLNQNNLLVNEIFLF
ncbi:MAG: chorismate lyase [Gammaproteobacteria bacterium]|nr:chorismate lyase [Gammaproteobacteria bacterium]